LGTPSFWESRSCSGQSLDALGVLHQLSRMYVCEALAYLVYELLCNLACTARCDLTQNLQFSPEEVTRIRGVVASLQSLQWYVVKHEPAATIAD